MLSSHQELTSKANSIYEEFIKNEAPKEVTGLHRVPFSRAAGELRKTDGVNSNFSCLLQVNLDFYTKNKIIQNLKEPNMAIFLAAQQKVYSLMENNSYPRFIHSELYNELLAAARRRKRSKGFKVDSKTRWTDEPNGSIASTKGTLKLFLSINTRDKSVEKKQLKLF